MESYFLQDSSIEGPSYSKDQELFTIDALGTVISELFADFASLFGIPKHSSAEKFNLFSVFVKDKNRFIYVGNLGKNGGILREGDMATSLRPHLHRSIKQSVDQYVTAIKHPFTRNITEFTTKKLAQMERPEGKVFSWLDMGMSQIHYVDTDKLSAKLGECIVDTSRPYLKNVECLYIIHKVFVYKMRHYFILLPESDIWVKRTWGSKMSRIVIYLKFFFSSKSWVIP